MSRNRVRLGSMMACGLTLTLWLSVDVALASPAPSTIRLAAWAGADYGARAGSFDPVDSGLVRELAGGRLARLIEGTAGVPVARRVVPVAPIPASDGGDIPPPPVDTPALLVTVDADRAEARQGDQIIYTVTTTNVGTAPAERVRIESHVPEGTGLVGWSCDGEAVLIDPDRRPISCVDANNVELTEAPSPAGHLVRLVGADLPPGESDVWRFAVRVHRTTPRGTLVRNHAHAEGNRVARTTSSAVVVEVR